MCNLLFLVVRFCSFNLRLVPYLCNEECILLSLSGSAKKDEVALPSRFSVCSFNLCLLLNNNTHPGDEGHCGVHHCGHHCGMVVQPDRSWEPHLVRVQALVHHQLRRDCVRVVLRGHHSNHLLRAGQSQEVHFPHARSRLRG